MSARKLLSRAAVGLLACLLLSSNSLLSAAILTWVGDVNNDWSYNVGGDTNWSTNTLPTATDDLVFVNDGVANFYSGDLTLGGSTFAANSIRVGDTSDLTAGGLSDFGVTNQVIGRNGTVQIGAGGIDVVMPAADGTFPTESRHVSLDQNIEVTANTSINRKTNLYASGKTRSLYLGGVISGGFNLDVVNEGANTSSKSILFEKNNTITGDVSLAGYFTVQGAGDFGDGNQVSFADAFSGYTYILNYSSNTTQDSDFVLSTTNWMQMGRFGGPGLTLTGDITGGDPSQRLQIYTLTSAKNFVFAGANQTFSNEVRATSGAKMIIANSNGSGVAWENVPSIWLNNGNYNGGTVSTDLWLRGDHTLNAPIRVGNITANNQVILGQSNDGGTSSDATFTGRIDFQETDVLALNLTADTGSSATFDGEINVNSAGGVGGGFGLNKIGAGTVIINGRVSEDLGNIIPIGDVAVQEGTLQVNSTAGAGGFNTSMITVEALATLSGTGQINGDVVVDVDGSVAPGASIGTLTVDGNVDINGALTAEVNSLSSDLLDVSGTLNLGGSSILELEGVLNGNTTYTLAKASSVVGTFSAIYLNGELVGPGDILNGLRYEDNAILLVAVPEPSSLLLLSLGACVMFRRGRRYGKRRIA